MALSIQALDSAGAASQRFKVTTGRPVGTLITASGDQPNIGSLDHASLSYVSGGVIFTATGVANGQYEITFSDGQQTLYETVIFAGLSPPGPPVPPSPPPTGTGYYEETCLEDQPIFEGFGTLTGSPAQVAGATQDAGDTGLQFNGSSQYGTTPFAGAPNGSASFSVECWVYPQTTGAGGALIGSSEGNNAGDGFELSLGATSSGAAQVEFGAGAFDVAQSFGQLCVVTAGKWNHVVATFDQTTGSVAMYLNGVFIARGGLRTTFNPNTQPILVGATWRNFLGTWSVAHFCDAAIGEVKFYDHELTIDRVIAHFAARDGAPAYPDVSTYTGDYYPTILNDSPAVYYRCDETSGAKCIDRSGNSGRDGAYGNAGFTLGEPGAIYDGDAAVNTTGIENSTGDFSGLISPILVLSGARIMSVEAWVFQAALNADHNVIACSSAEDAVTTQGGFLLETDGTGKPSFTVNVGASNASAASSTPLPTGQWNYVVGTYDGDAVLLYVNGSLAASNSTSGQLIDTFRWNVCFGFCRNFNGNNNGQWQGTLDECALYPYALTAAQVKKHHDAGLGPLPAPIVGAIIADDRHYFDLRIYDKHGTLIDLPKGDIEKIDVTDVLNGGSATGTITFRRGINSIGQVANLNRVLLWVWWGRIARPLNPTWAGYMEDIDQEKTSTLGQIVANVQGDSNHLNRGIVSEKVNPGAAFGNPDLDAADYLRHLFTTYAPPGYFHLVCPPSLFPLLPVQFTRQKLASVIDTITKTGRDADGQFIVWRVNCDYNLNRTLLVQSDQNPNNVSGVNFKHIFVDGMCSKYKISTKYRDIVNVVLVEGGKDPFTGQTVASVFEDSNSVAEFDPWEDAISVPSLLTADACNAYGEVYLDIHANPQAQGEIELFNPDPSILSGVWIQAWENAASIKQLRIASVRFEVGATRIVQTLSPQAPTPYLDEAVYKLGMNTQLAATAPIRALPVNTQQNFVRSGVTISGAG